MIKKVLFLLPEKGRTEMDNECEINFIDIDLILQSHECRKWVDLTSNFIYCPSNLFEKVFVGLNHQIFQF